MNFYCTTEHCSCMGIKQFSAGKAIRCTAKILQEQIRAVLWLLQMVRRAGGVCVNDQSEHVADFVWDERGCKE